MKSPLPKRITTVEEAKLLLVSLHYNGETFHPQDDATKLVGDPFTETEGKHLNQLMQDIYNIKGNSDAQNMLFDPCRFLIELDTMFQYMDKTGRGFKSKMNLSQILQMEDEQDWYDKWLHEWAQEAEAGDEWESSETKFIRL